MSENSEEASNELLFSDLLKIKQFMKESLYQFDNILAIYTFDADKCTNLIFSCIKSKCD